MVIWLVRTARFTWIISGIMVFKFIGFVSVIKAIRVIVTLNEYAKASRSVRNQVRGKGGGMCKLSVHFEGKDCTYGGHRSRSHGLRRGACRGQGCPGHPGRKLCSLIRLFFRTDFVLVSEL
jgi:hypothetical protein